MAEQVLLILRYTETYTYTFNVIKGVLGTPAVYAGGTAIRLAEMNSNDPNHQASNNLPGLSSVYAITNLGLLDRVGPGLRSLVHN